MRVGFLMGFVPSSEEEETHREKACGKRDGVIDAVTDAAASQ